MGETTRVVVEVVLLGYYVSFLLVVVRYALAQVDYVPQKVASHSG